MSRGSPWRVSSNLPVMVSSVQENSSVSSVLKYLRAAETIASSRSRTNTERSTLRSRLMESRRRIISCVLICDMRCSLFKVWRDVKLPRCQTFRAGQALANHRHQNHNSHERPAGDSWHALWRLGACIAKAATRRYRNRSACSYLPGTSTSWRQPQGSITPSGIQPPREIARHGIGQLPSMGANQNRHDVRSARPVNDETDRRSASLVTIGV